MEPGQLTQLQKEMAVFKVVEKGITTEILPGPAATAKPQNDGDFMNKYNRKESMEVALPDKLFVIRTEKMRPYKRLDLKFQTLFNNAV